MSVFRLCGFFYVKSALQKSKLLITSQNCILDKFNYCYYIMRIFFYGQRYWQKPESSGKESQLLDSSYDFK